jgi:hypothetical protein
VETKAVRTMMWLLVGGSGRVRGDWGTGPGSLGKRSAEGGDHAEPLLEATASSIAQMFDGAAAWRSAVRDDSGVDAPR